MQKSLQSIYVSLEDRSYPINFSDSFDALTESLGDSVRGKKCCIISNPTIWPIYGPTVSAAVSAAGAETTSALIPDGEVYKNIPELEKLLDNLVKQKLNRSSLIIALGGGVVGDISGFAASVFMRGIPFIQIPTTLLAQVDSSIGGKTGVNLSSGKNLVGAFYQPKMVFINWNILTTLPICECRAGYAEIIKSGIIADKFLFLKLEEMTCKIFDELSNKPPVISDSLAEIIKRCCVIKADVVANDEREKGTRAILNYGHTFAHAIEVMTNYTKFVHGEAVAIGMHAAAVFACMLGLCDENLVNRQKKLIESAGLPTQFPDLQAEKVISEFYHDKKSEAEDLNFVLPMEIGKVEIVKNPDLKILASAIEKVKIVVP